MGGQDQITSNESAVCGEASWMADGGLGHDATETTRDPISRRGSTGGGCCGTEGTRTTEEGRGGEGRADPDGLYFGAAVATPTRKGSFALATWRAASIKSQDGSTECCSSSVQSVSVVLCSSPLNSSIGVILTSAIGNISPSHRIL